MEDWQGFLYLRLSLSPTLPLPHLISLPLPCCSSPLALPPYQYWLCLETKYWPVKALNYTKLQGCKNFIVGCQRVPSRGCWTHCSLAWSLRESPGTSPVLASRARGKPELLLTLRNQPCFIDS